MGSNMPPETKYAKSGGVNIAYQVTGEGPFDLVLVPGWVSHVENAWEEPSFARFLHRLKSFCRLILLDRRGTGLSDPVAKLPTLEQRMDDVRAVMDAAGSKKAALFGISEGGPMCILFAATYPERTSALVLYGTFARGLYDPEYSSAPTPAQIERLLEHVDREWGTGMTARMFAPSIAQDDRHVQSWGRFERLAVSPGAARTLIHMYVSSDVRHVLPVIRVSTLVLHRSGDQVTPVGGGRYLAEYIPGAKYVELSGEDHFPWTGDADAVLDEVEEFLTGARHGPELDRMLATVLFTDIVGSTERAVELGDRQWQELLEHHHRLVRSELNRFRGREVDTAGDGFFATFDGPARAVRCGCAIQEAVARIGLTIRVGLHTGECEVSGGKVSGIAVHIGARVMAEARPGEVLVSSTVKDLVAGSGLRFVDRGGHTLKGIPGEWNLFTV
jgi:class 3 adenylate cyclase/alpha-beta hydrolase superfamily lysophospholipase